MAEGAPTVGIVIPWYGEQIPGGAEAAARDLAKAIAAAGQPVEVLTTCVREFRADWNENHHPEGLTVEGGIRVRRFPVRRRDTAAFDRVNYKLIHRLPVSPEEEQIFVDEMIQSPALCGYLGRHSSEYVYFFIPYMFGTTYWGSQVCPERSVLIPCLHDESYAHLEVFRQMMRRARVLVFLSHEEQALAQRLHGIDGESHVLGTPVACNWTGNAERFTSRYGHSGFLLYAGRTDQGKNAELLADHFRRYIHETASPLRLVFIGGEPPPDDSGRIVGLGFLPPQDKYDCYSAALALCVPSAKESFSLVMMESWLAGRPAIVNAACPVTTGFCRRSNGGLYFADYDDFREIVAELERRPELGAALGRQGGQFVRRNFAPEIVAARYLRLLADLM
jgi:glycosyltransferase involved in cell wall biosynthesis